jgi:hypothetical protein
MLIEIYTIDGEEVEQSFKGENCVEIAFDYLKNHKNRIIKVMGNIDMEHVRKIALDLPVVSIMCQISFLELLSVYADRENTIFLNEEDEYKLVVFDDSNEVTILTSSEHFSCLGDGINTTTFVLENGWAGEGLRGTVTKFVSRNGKELYCMKIEDTSRSELLYFRLSEASISPIKLMDEVFDKLLEDYGLYEIQGSKYFSNNILSNLNLNVMDGENVTHIPNLDVLVSYLNTNNMALEVVEYIRNIDTEIESEFNECSLDKYWLKTTVNNKELEDLLSYFLVE